MAGSYFTWRANPRPAAVRGFFEKNFISFTKEYPYHNAIDEDGHTSEDLTRPHPVIAYSGFYNIETGRWAGVWEIHIELGRAGQSWDDYYCSGTWEMTMITAATVIS